MAHFYGGVVGNRGEATRLGTGKSGLRSFSNGWNIGADVYLYERECGDVIRIALTGGSNRGGDLFSLIISQDELKDSARLAEILEQAASHLRDQAKAAA